MMGPGRDLPSSSSLEVVSSVCPLVGARLTGAVNIIFLRSYWAKDECSTLVLQRVELKKYEVTYQLLGDERLHSFTQDPLFGKVPGVVFLLERSQLYGAVYGST